MVLDDISEVITDNKILASVHVKTLVPFCLK